ncbi:emp24p/erv25p- protein [Mitosporidium daphniae]
MLLLYLAICCGLFVNSCRGIHFYLEPNQKRCFIEHLPRHTVFLGVYSTQVYNPYTNKYTDDPLSSVSIIVDSERENLLKQTGSSSDRFFFTSGEHSEHIICLSSNNPTLGSQNGWWSQGSSGSSNMQGSIKMTFEVFIGDPGEPSIVSPIEAKVAGLAQTVSQLNTLVSEIRREQYLHREREAEFRSLSEYVNGQVVWWTIAQILVLTGVASWQVKRLGRTLRTKRLI